MNNLGVNSNIEMLIDMSICFDISCSPMILLIQVLNISNIDVFCRTRFWSTNIKLMTHIVGAVCQLIYYFSYSMHT